jgi:hypothetical protein
MRPSPAAEYSSLYEDKPGGTFNFAHLAALRCLRRFQRDCDDGQCNWAVEQVSGEQQTLDRALRK